MTPCPHCGTFVEPGVRVCPHCGTGLGASWPPPPSSTPPEPPRPPRTLTGRVWADFLLGAAFQYLTHLATARVLVYNMPIVHHHSRDWIVNAGNGADFVLCEIFWAIVFGWTAYYGFHSAYPVIAQGSGYASVALLTVLLGAFVICTPVPY